MAEIEGWFTMNGVHIPIMKGQSKAEAAKNYMNSKHGKTVAKLSKSSGKDNGSKSENAKKFESSFKNLKDNQGFSIHTDNKDEYHFMKETRNNRSIVYQDYRITTNWKGKREVVTESSKKSVSVKTLMKDFEKEINSGNFKFDR